MMNVCNFGRAAARACNSGAPLRGLIALQRRNQCKYEDDNKKMAGYDEQESQFTDQELNLFKKLFLKYDRDENCKLDRWEFNNFAKYLVGRSYNSIDLEKVFHKLDKNDDSFVDWSELMSHVQDKYMDSVKKFLQTVFKEHDRDGDGKLRYWETKLALESLGYKTGFDKDVFKTLTKRSDGLLTFEEFSDHVVLKKYNSLADLKKTCEEL